MGFNKKKWYVRFLIRFLIAGLLVILMGLVFVYYMRINFRQMANEWLHSQNIKAEIDFKEIHVGGIRSVTFEGLRVHPKNSPDRSLIDIGNLRIRYTLLGLLKREVEMISVEQPVFRLSKEMDSLMDKPSSENSQPEKKAWTIGNLKVVQGAVHLRNLGEAIPPVIFEFQTSMKNVSLGQSGDEIEPLLKAEIKNLKIYSPWDVFTPVLDFPSIVIMYKISNLLKKKIDHLEFKEPVIYVGEDLFWLVNYVKEQAEDKPAQEKNALPWTIGNFRVTDGQVAIHYLGRMQLILPLKFQTFSRNVQVGSFENIQLTQVFEFEQASFFYPEYDLVIKDVTGKLEFAMPPDTDSNNIVQLVRVKKAKWKDFEIDNMWLSATFDQKGMYFLYGGESYGGYLNGNANILLKDLIPWDASLAVSEMDLDKLTKATAQDRFYMSGQADLKMIVNSEGRFIKKVKGDLTLADQGMMRIPPMDFLYEKIDKLPWEEFKKQLTESVLKGFGEYHYTQGEIDFDYTPDGGFLNFFLDGDQGKRKIRITLKDDVFNQLQR